eukprot:Tbor_TRINITY_DN5889_c1_g7::TRINITY_DN5889_c1_g7_i2::g.7312::m.7312
MLKRINIWLEEDKVQREEMAVDTFIIAKFLKEKKIKNWTAGTLHTYLSSVTAALRAFPLYRQGGPSIYVGERFKAAIKSTKMQANREGVRNIIPQMSEIQQKIIYKTMRTDQDKALISITWAFAGRLGDILKLKIENSELKEKGSEVMFSCKFVEGKTASRENYIINLPISEASFMLSNFFPLASNVEIYNSAHSCELSSSDIFKKKFIYFR